MPLSAMCLAVALCTLSAVRSQPFDFEAVKAEPDISEAVQRRENNYTGFTFNFTTASPGTDVTPNGMLQANQVSTNPFLSTLSGDGNGQTLVTLGPCASNTPHTHPRGSEISFVLYGAIEFGMVEENAGMNDLVFRNVVQNTTIHIPQGILHFSFNPTCEPAAFLANFATADPGTQTMWNSMMRVPTHILNAATGVSEAILDQLKRLPQVKAPGTGGEECMARCAQTTSDFTFKTQNNLSSLTDDQIVA